MAVGEKRYRDSHCAQENHIIHADADQTRIIQSWNGDFAGFERKEQSKDEQKAMEGIKHDYPYSEMRPYALFPVKDCLVITIVRKLWKKRSNKFIRNSPKFKLFNLKIVSLYFIILITFACIYVKLFYQYFSVKK